MLQFAADGHFKELSWTAAPEKFLAVDESGAKLYLRNWLIKD